MYIYIVLLLYIKLDTFSENSFPIWGHASVRLPGVLHTKVGHSKTLPGLLAEAVESEMVDF